MSTDVEAGGERVRLGLVLGLPGRRASKPKLGRSAHFGLVSLKIQAAMAGPREKKYQKGREPIALC